MSNHTRIVLTEVGDERERQEKKWGQQNHPSIISPGPEIPLPVKDTFQRYGLDASDAAGFKRVTDVAAEDGNLTYADILMEEVAEAIEAAVESEELLREELIQVAAVAVAWIEAIDRRATKESDA